jgi:Protein of unknown function (DUF1573)
MRVLGIILAAALFGSLVGGAVAYVEVRNDVDPLTELPGDLQIAQRATNEPVPKAQAAESHYDFGTMQRGTTKSHDFEIRNTGAAPLILKAGSTTCKCTLSEVSEAPIPPGGSTHVKVQWTAKSDNGPFRQTASVFTNDPLHPTLELIVDGEILSASGIEPADLTFGKIAVGESRTAQVFVMSMLQDDLTVSDPELSDPAMRDYFDVKIEPADVKELPNKSAKRGVRVTVTAKPGLPVGRFFQWLSIKTNLADAEKLEIPVQGQVVGDISVHGNGWSEDQGALKVGSVKSGEGFTGKLNILIRGDDAAKVTFQLKSADPAELKVKLGEPIKLRDSLVQVPLEIQIPPGMRPMVRLDTAQGEPGRIVLSTTHPKIKELALGVHFSVER